MTLTTEEQAILDGEQGEQLQRAMKTVVTFGELFGDRVDYGR
jgi:predicted aconitase